ncbi:MAG: DUF1761 domain-containing protein [Spirochaetia bacterium]
MTVPTNFLAVVVAALASFGLGALWYAVLFGKTWQRLSGTTEVKQTAVSLIVVFVGSLFMSFVLHHAIIFANTFLKTSGVGGGLMVGFFNWIGFIAPVTIGVVTYQKRPFALWLLDNAYWLISLLVMGIILSVWQ